MANHYAVVAESCRGESKIGAAQPHLTFIILASSGSQPDIPLLLLRTMVLNTLFFGLLRSGTTDTSLHGFFGKVFHGHDLQARAATMMASSRMR